MCVECGCEVPASGEEPRGERTTEGSEEPEAA